MHPVLLKSASGVIPNPQLLINVVRQRVRQLIRGHRPLIQAAPGMGFCDVALSEVIAGKLSYEVAPGVKPDSSFAPIVTFPSVPSEKKAAYMVTQQVFTRRTPDIMTEELCAILSQKVSYEFKPLYELVYANLHTQCRERGDEMLRLRL
jgi:DNA-directed RNA polymerase subunit omega